GVTVEEARLFTDPARAEVDMVFQFEHVQLDQGASKWEPHPLRLHDLNACPTSAGPPSTGTTTTSRASSRASATTATTACGRPSCSARCCICTAGRPTSTRARSSG